MKKYKILDVVFIITAISLALISAWQFWPAKTIWFEKGEEVAEVFPKSKFVDKITGLPSDNENDLDPQIVSIMIDNHPAAYPLYGLNEAKIVYEAPVEGGMTRFMAIFAKHQEVSKIGPIRSARPDYFDWAKEYGSPLYMHCGGSPEALRLLKIEKEMINLDEFSNYSFFWRLNSKSAPHNLFTSSSLWLKAFEKYEKEPLMWQTFRFGQNKNDTIGEKIEVEYSKSFDVQWQYDAESKVYERYMNDKKTIDDNGNALSAQTIIITKNKVKILDEVGRREIHNIGSGQAYIFSQGRVVVGFWKKSKAEFRTRFYDENDEELAVPPGKIWFMSVPEEIELKLF